jgi:hypothetical protein
MKTGHGGEGYRENGLSARLLATGLGLMISPESDADLGKTHLISDLAIGTFYLTLPLPAVTLPLLVTVERFLMPARDFEQLCNWFSHLFFTSEFSSE